MTVTVTIEGASKSGKSQIANVIHNALIHASNQHYDVEIVDEGVKGDGQRLLRNVDNSSHVGDVKIFVRQTDAEPEDELDDIPSDDNDNVPLDDEDKGDSAASPDADAASETSDADTAGDPEPTDAADSDSDATEPADATETGVNPVGNDAAGDITD